jgi:hypothetical protein
MAVCVYFLAPTVVRDASIDSATLVPAAEQKIDSFKCTNHNLYGLFPIYSDCTIEYSSREAAASARHSLKYTFFGPVPEKRATLLKLADNPGLVVADIGLKHVWNRMAMVAALGLIFVLFAFGGVMRLSRP